MNRWLLLACVLAVAGIGAWLHHCNKNDRAAESHLSRAQTIAYDDPGSTVATKPPPPPRRNGAAVESGAAILTKANALGVRPSSAEQPGVPTVPGGDSDAERRWREVETAGHLLALGAPGTRSPGSRSRGAATREGAGARVDGSSNAQRAQKRSTGEAGLASIPAPLTAARACFGEERFSLAGCAAVVYAIKRQAHAAERSFADQAVAYCSSLKGSSPRQRLVQQLPDGDEPSWNEKQNRAWAAVRRTARLALAGRIPNPCPRAQHFGGMDLEPDATRAAKAVREGRWRRVRCYGEDISGTYFALVSTRGEVVAAAEAAGVREP